MYATAYKQNFFEYRALLCVSIATSMTEEGSCHAELIGAPVLDDQSEIKDFSEVRVVGKCDGTCRESHPGQVKKMMGVGEQLRVAIINSPGFEEAVR